MATDYKAFLAAEVLSESRIVSYRILSRELKVHSNVAKKMLYDFHYSQNARKPGSVHATYLLYGTAGAKPMPAEESQKDGEDIYMQSSPFMSSSMPQEESIQEAPPLKVVTLAREEDLEAAKARYDEVLSIHVYSLEPSTIQNLHILTDCNRRIRSQHAHEDPLEFNKHYGTVLNPNVKRRIGRRPPPPPAIAEPAKAAKAPERVSSNSKGGSQPTAKPEAQPTQANNISKPSTSSKQSSQKPPPLKKEKSDIFKAFSKPKFQTTTAKLTRENTDASTTSTSQPPEAAQEDAPMFDASSESEKEEDLMPITTASKSGTKKPGGVSKAEREATLKQMMEEASSNSSKDDEAAPSPPAEPATLENPTVPKETTPDPPATVTGGRRRGRRKVTKKKTVKDDEGYLITREEPAWESFSESEPEVVAKKQQQMPSSSAASSSAGQKGGKKAAGGGKQGQGNIMSFFGKR